MSNSIFQRKQVWLKRLMASRLTHVHKTFGYSIWERMYGDKLESYPSTSDIMQDGGFPSSGHFSEYRQALVDCGALEVDLDYHTKNAMAKNCLYTLNLDWNGSVPPKSHSTPGKSHSTPGKSHSTPGKSHSTPGAPNTSSNPSSKPSSKPSSEKHDASADASSSGGLLSEGQGHKEDRGHEVEATSDEEPFSNLLDEAVLNSLEEGSAFSKDDEAPSNSLKGDRHTTPGATAPSQEELAELYDQHIENLYQEKLAQGEPHHSALAIAKNMATRTFTASVVKNLTGVPV